MKETEAGSKERAKAGQYGADVMIGGEKDTESEIDAWTRSLKSASVKLDQAFALATASTDLSSRLDTRIAMLREEIAMKREMLGIV